MKSIEQFFRDNGDVMSEDTIGFKQGLRGKIIQGDYSIRITGETNEGVVGYIYPSGRSGETINVVIKENRLVITNLCK